MKRSFLLLLSAVLIQLNARAQTTQTVTGNVYDEASKTPLTGVIVMLVNVSQPKSPTSDSTGSISLSSVPMGTATDIAGNFKLGPVPIGRQSFKVSYTGYEDRVINDVVVTAGKEVHLNIGMQEALHKLDEVTVSYNKAKDKTRTNNDMALVSARSFNVDETKRYAGALGDPSRMAANFAGVVSGNDARNDIVVRGNSPSGMLWQLEGLNIPNPNHYGSLSSTGGPVSMLNNNNIDKSDFMTSAFPAQYGNAVAGVFDMKLRDGNKDKNEFIGQLSFNGFELGAEGPIGKNKQTSYVINYRYSALSLFQKMGMNFGTGAAVPNYQDVNYKITSNLSRKSKLIVFGIAGSSKIDFLGKDVDTTKQELYSGDPYANERNKFGTTITGVSYEHHLSDKTFTKLTLGYSTTFEQFTLDSISYIDRSLYPNAKARFATGKLSAVWSVAHKIDARNNITGGATYDRLGFDLLNKEMHPSENKVIVDQSGAYGLVQSYLSWKHRYSNKLSTVAGLHGQYLSLNNNIAVEPRLSVRYALNSRQALSMGYGLHNQAQNVYTYFVQTPVAGGTSYTNKGLGYIRSQHVVLTYDLNITEHMRLKAEAYYQALGNVPVEQNPSSFSILNTGSSFGPTDADSLVNKGRGYNYGTELTLERFFDKGYYFLITTSLFNSKYKGSDGKEHNTGFNTGHVFNALAGKEFKLGCSGSVLALNLKVSNVGGRYLTPIDLEQSKLEGKAVYKTDLAFTDKQPDYFRTDLRIAYRKEYKRSTLEVAIDFQNLTNNKNIFNQYYDTKKNRIVTTYQQEFFPVPMIRYTF